MNEEEFADVDAVLRSQLSDGAEWSLHDRSIKTPMNFTLAIAEEHLGSQVTVFWAENSLPEVFCLKGFSQPVVVFNPRLLELWSDLRYIFTTKEYSGSLKASMVERFCLQLIAERSLWRQDDPELSTTVILRASSIEPGLINFRNSLQTMEYEPITPVYMNCWFFALAHEFGHFASSDTSLFSDDSILNTLKNELRNYSSLPENFKSDVASKCAANERNFILAIEAIREEGIADVFATALLFESTYRIMQEIDSDEHEFNLASFITEVFVSLNIIVIFSRCERVCNITSSTNHSHEFATETVIHPILIAIRSSMIRQYLEPAALSFVYGNELADENYESISKTIDSIMDTLKDDVDSFEKGLADAIKFTLNRGQRPDFFESIRNWNETEKNPQILTEFLSLAAKLDLQSPHLEAISTKVKDPYSKVNIPTDTVAYYCPFVKGPEGYKSPHCLVTRHGNIIFVFKSNSRLCRHYCNASSDGLLEGYFVEPSLILANSIKQLENEIGRRLPVGTPVKLVVEETEDFSRFIEELSEGTIWND